MFDKIYTVFLHGSYGTYLSWAVYSYSNLNATGQIDLPFDANGSAHLYRSNPGYNYVRPTHTAPSIGTKFILVKPTAFLDYLDNHYAKQEGSNADKFMSNIIKDVNLQLISVSEKRELCSVRLPNFFQFQQNHFAEIERQISSISVCVTADNILTNILGVLNEIWRHYGLTQTCDDSDILNIHNTYLSLQQHTGKHQYVQNIVNDCVNGVTSNITGLTVFDEAYVQFLLREQGYELPANLKVFPATTAALRDLLNFSD